MTLTSKQKDALRRDGFVKIPGLVPAEKVREARRSINVALGMPAPAGAAGRALAKDPAAYYCSSLGQTAPILELFHSTPLRPLVQSLLGEDKLVPLMRNAVVVRFPQVPNWTERTRFHVDGVSDEHEDHDESESHTLAAGVYLSDAASPWHGNYALIPGSHAGGARREPVQLLAKAGDVILHHSRVAHSAFALENRSPDIFYMAVFGVRHVDHDALKAKAVKDPWIEWPGMRSAPAR